MKNPAPRAPKKPGVNVSAAVSGDGTIAQGRLAKAAGKRAVIVGGDNTAPVNTGDTYQTIIQQAARPGATTADLRKGYLAWLSMRANQLPLFAGDSGKPVQLSSIYTALLTEARNAGDAQFHAGRAERALPDRDGDRQSALDALNQERYLVLMGGPGSGKTTFLNFVALCMAGEMLGLAANLELLRSPIPPDPDAPDGKPKRQRWGHGALLAVRVVLRDFAADLPPPGTGVTGDAPWNFIVKQLPRQLEHYADHLHAELLRDGGLILLDGLDEVPDALQRREQVKQAVQEFAGLYRDCRFLVTSRTYAYQRQDWKLAGFAERELLPFTRGQIERFIDCWYVHMTRLFRLNPDDANGRAEVLKRATQRPELTELAERPLLLTLMARLQTKGGGSLPENRERLYAESVDMLLDEWEGFKLRRDASGHPIAAEPSLSEWLNATGENIRRELDKLAYEAHLKQPTLVGTADVRQPDLIAALMAAARDKADTKLMRLEEYLRDRAGLLASHGEGLYQFPHRSFQEYLAACHLARFDFPDTLSRLTKADPNRWREVALLAGARSRETPAAIWELVEELCAKDEAPPETAPEPGSEAQWGTLLAGQVLVETGLAEGDPNLQERHERKRKRVRDWQLRVLRSTSLPARERALAGDLLARLGENREYLLNVDHMRFSLVPAGPFWMGEERDDHSKPHLNSSLDYDYWIALTPVTVAQFMQFLASGANKTVDPDALRYPNNRPIVSISWDEARAFCTWLTERWRRSLPKGWCAMLPSEAEWEKAARGGVGVPLAVQVRTAMQGFCVPVSALHDNPTPQRNYPWGDDFVSEKANVAETVGSSSTPGCFEAGRSPYGCDDMAGNVFEWTRSVWGSNWQKPEFDYPYDSNDSRREDPNAGNDVLRVARGGSWSPHRDYARCAYRLRDRPGDRFVNVGFRVVLRSSPVS